MYHPELDVEGVIYYVPRHSSVNTNMVPPIASKLPPWGVYKGEFGYMCRDILYLMCYHGRSEYMSVWGVGKLPTALCVVDLSNFRETAFA